MATTQSDIFGAELVRPQRRVEPALFMVLRGNEPLAPSSQHVIGKIDAVRFGRGEPAMIREVVNGENHLVLRIDDPTMSIDHGRLIAQPGAWRLDDPASKNGAVVEGQPTRRAQLAYGHVFSLGHTVFLLDRVEVDPGAALDRSATTLQPPVPELATFHARFAGELDVAARLAAADLPVLLLGESGTGKEVVARALHECSSRPGAFVAVNCGSIPSELVESELFGHRRGSFSGAVADRLGYVRAADRGMLFLDEIGELPAPAQAALLRVLQQREVVPVGDSMPVAVDLRLCAATHRDLAGMTEAGLFRHDLHARLAGATVRLPRLHERRADLGILIASLLRRRHDGDRLRFSAAAAAALVMYRWPQNVRELERALASAAALADAGKLGVDHLPDPVASMLDPQRVGRPVPVLTSEELAERDELLALLQECGGNVAEVARRLDKDRTQVYRMMRRFGISRDER